MDTRKVHEGCKEERGRMPQIGRGDKVTSEKARNETEGKIVGTLWVLVKKGD